MNSRILFAVVLAAFAGIAWTKDEIVLNGNTFGKNPRVLESGKTYVVRDNVEFHDLIPVI